MTSITADYEYDSSRSGHKSSSTMEHQNNGQGKQEDERKLFVGGLTWDTTTDDLREYFSNFGPVLECSIKQDPTTGRSRGFAFLVFESKDVVEKVLSQSDHFVKGRKVDPKPAHRRIQANNAIPTLNNNNNNNHHHQHHHSAQSAIYGMTQSGSMSYSTMSMPSNLGNASNNNRKVFIGGLDPNFPDSQLREYFSKFGQIDEIDLPFDKEKNERRPFCFISFLSEQAAQEVLRLQRHTIGDISVDVKRAKPKTVNNQQQQQRGHLYDPYGQHTTAYTNYNAAIPSYGGASYQPAAATADPYANWNAYNYNAQANPAAAASAYSYSNQGSASVSSPGTSSYPSYAEHQTNSQYQYPPSNTNTMTDYYPHYAYGAPVAATTGVYADPNAYGGNYDLSQYYSAMNAGGMVDNGAGQTSGNPTDHELDNRHGKAKTTILADSLYHPYARN